MFSKTMHPTSITNRQTIWHDMLSSQYVGIVGIPFSFVSYLQMFTKLGLLYCFANMHCRQVVKEEVGYMNKRLICKQRYDKT